MLAAIRYVSVDYAMSIKRSPHALVMPLLLVVGCLGRGEPPRLAAAPMAECGPEPASMPGSDGNLRPRVAVTIDDLPGSEIPSAHWPKSRIMTELIAILQAHRVPVPVGFVNGIYAAGQADAERALRRWVEVGFQLGNHSYSHLSANELDVAAFLADVARNETLLAALSGPAAPRYFRFPYLERGGTPDKRRSLRAALHEQGYRIADVSIDFADWAFTPPFARCMAAGDEAALRALSAAYLDNAMAALYWSHESAQRLFGRPIPQVLLLHAIVPTVRNLDGLLTAYEKAGVELISLREALADPAYAEEPDLDHGDTGVLTEAVRRRQAPINSFVPRGIPLLELACQQGG